MSGLENRWPVSTGSGVRIPLPPLTMRESAPAAGIRAQAPNSAPMRNTPIQTANPGGSGWGTRSRLAHACLATAAGVALGFVPMTASAATATKPCAKHTRYTAVTKSDCLAAHRKQARRDRVRWPKYPVTTRDLRARDIAIARWVRLGRCEAGHGSGYGGVRWNTPSGWRWQGGLGMYDRSHASTGHPYGYDAGQWNWQTQVLVARRLKDKYGITAWSAWRCW